MPIIRTHSLIYVLCSLEDMIGCGPPAVVDPMDGASPSSCVTLLLLLVSVAGTDWYSSHVNWEISSTMIRKRMSSCNYEIVLVSLSEISHLQLHSMHQRHILFLRHISEAYFSCKP